MKVKSVLSIVLVAFFLFNCKKNKPIDSLEVITPKPILSNNRIVFDLIVPEDDIFQIFYTVDGTSNFNEEMSVRVNITGSNENQSIVFEFPEDIFITRYRVDVGENTNQGTIKINKFTIHYFAKKFEIIGSDFFNYFTPTDQIEVVKDKSIIAPKKVGDTYDPLFYQTDNILNAELEKIQN